MCDSSRRPSPFCSIKVPNIGTSIEVLRLICGRLQCHVAAASNPRFASSVKAGKSGCSRRGSTSSLIINLKPCMDSDGSCGVPGACLLMAVVSSNQVGRMDLTPMVLLEFAFLMLSRRRLG